MRKFLLLTFIIIFPFASSYAEDLPPIVITDLNLKVSLIAIDPGFGGREAGPSGCEKQVFAKDVNLAISKKIVEKIKSDLGIDAFLTREFDEYISLEERAAKANTKGADLFIAIHLNGSDDPSVVGTETYCLNLSTQPDAVRTGIAENTTDPKNIADMNLILSELMANTKIHESNRLAKHVQAELVAHLIQKHDGIKNRGVKYAPFYIFLSADMPSIMVQVSFLTHPYECKRIVNDNYQNDISGGIVKGIRKYLESIN